MRFEPARRWLLMLIAATGGVGWVAEARAQAWNPDCYNGRLTCVSIGAPRELTPAEKAEQERRAREAAAAKAEFERQVDVEVKRLGPQRRPEAERLVRMRTAAQAVKPKTPYPPRTCSTTTVNEARSGAFPFMAGSTKTYQAEGRAEMLRNVESACPGGSMADFSCKGGGAIGFFSCKVAYSCPVKKTTCTGGPPTSKVTPQ